MSEMIERVIEAISDPTLRAMTRERISDAYQVFLATRRERLDVIYKSDVEHSNRSMLREDAK